MRQKPLEKTQNPTKNQSVSSQLIYLSTSSLFTLISLLITPTLTQNNPICKAKRYMCKEETVQFEDPDICVKVVDEQAKYYHLKPCTDTSKPHCPHETASYGNPAKCIAEPSATEKKLPGEECTAGTDCLSLECSNQVCKGKVANEVCRTHSDCDPKLFCNFENICQAQRQFDESCR